MASNQRPIHIFHTRIGQSLALVELKSMKSNDRCSVEMWLGDDSSMTEAMEAIELRVVVDSDPNPPLAGLQRAALLRAREILDEQIRHLGSIVSR